MSRANTSATLGSSLKWKVGSSLFGHNTSSPNISARLRDVWQTALLLRLLKEALDFSTFNK